MQTGNNYTCAGEDYEVRENTKISLTVTPISIALELMIIFSLCLNSTNIKSKASQVQYHKLLMKHNRSQFGKAEVVTIGPSNGNHILINVRIHVCKNAHLHHHSLLHCGRSLHAAQTICAIVVIVVLHRV